MKNIIQAQDIHKTYHSGGADVKALQGVTLDIEIAEFIIITGRNGSGKSTLMHQLALLDNPSKGEILIDNQNVTHMSEKDRMKLRLSKLGYIFQEYALIAELNALENVMLPAMMSQPYRFSKEKAMKLLEKLELADKYKRLPTQLSGGEQQKVAIARALINDPKIIFADEPTANLDSKASKEVMGIFTKLNTENDITIVMVSHEAEELVYASRQIVLSDGKLQ